MVVNPTWPTPGFWRGASGRHLTVDLFLSYVVVPFVATALIKEDMKVTTREADNIRLDSHKFGTRLRNLDDTKLDELVDQINDQVRRCRFRKVFALGFYVH